MNPNINDTFEDIGKAALETASFCVCCALGAAFVVAALIFFGIA